jgi:mono/diheme cytochrome c family protein
MSPKIDHQSPSRSPLALVVVLFVCCALFGNLLSAQEKGEQKDKAKEEDKPAAEVFNAEYAKLKNSEKDTPENIAAGKAVYLQFCANCHGDKGAGDGGDNRGGTTIPDLTDKEWLFGATDGELFMVIKEGTGSPDMIGYKNEVEEKEIWQTVLFIRTLAKKPAAN